MPQSDKSKNPKTPSLDDLPTQFKTPVAAGDGFLPLLDKIKAQTDQKKASKASTPPRERPTLPPNPQYDQALQSAYQKAVEAGLIKPKQK